MENKKTKVLVLWGRRDLWIKLRKCTIIAEFSTYFEVLCEFCGFLRPEAKIWEGLGMEKSGNMFYYLVVIHPTVITHILWFPSLCTVLSLWPCLALGFSCAQSPSFPLQSASICFHSSLPFLFSSAPYCRFCLICIKLQHRSDSFSKLLSEY